MTDTHLRRAGAFVCALFLCACAFTSDAPFFREREAVQPFANGAQFRWLENGTRDQRAIVFQREGRAYAVLSLADGVDERSLHALFVPIRETREEDYVVQTVIEEGDGVAYAFLWRTESGYRFVINLMAFEARPGDLARYCEERAYNECHFASRRDLIAFYRAHVLPAFVRPGAPPPGEFIDLRPVTAEAR